MSEATKVKLSNKRLSEGFPYLGALGSLDLRPKIGFRVGTVKAALMPLMQAFETESRKLVDKYCERDAGNNPVLSEGGTKLKNPTAYQKDMEELLAVENEVAVHKLKLDELRNVKNEEIPLSGNLCYALNWLIEP